jgi:hypothetical protein
MAYLKTWLATSLLLAIVAVGTIAAAGPQWTRQPAWEPPEVGDRAAPALADLDDDGDFDLMIGYNSGISLAYENTGSASSPVWTRQTAWDTLLM